MRVGLRQGCLWSQILLKPFMDRVSRRCQGAEGLCFGGTGISSLHFTDVEVLLASSAAGMKISTSKFETMVLSQKREDCPLRVGSEVLAQMEEFKYLVVLFTSDGRMEEEIDRQIGAASAVERTLD